jgi:hypothetical protein
MKPNQRLLLHLVLINLFTDDDHCHGVAGRGECLDGRRAVATAGNRAELGRCAWCQWSPLGPALRAACNSNGTHVYFSRKTEGSKQGRLE